MSIDISASFRRPGKLEWEVMARTAVSARPLSPSRNQTSRTHSDPHRFAETPDRQRHSPHAVPLLAPRSRKRPRSSGCPPQEVRRPVADRFQPFCLPNDAGVRLAIANSLRRLAMVHGREPVALRVVGPGGSAQVVYADGCAVPVQPGSVVAVTPESPCLATGAIDPSPGISGTTLAIGAVAVGGGTAALLLLSRKK